MSSKTLDVESQPQSRPSPSFAPLIPTWKPYGVATLGIVVAALIRQALDPVLNGLFSYFTFYFAIVLISYLYGLKPGLFSLVGGYFVGTYLFVEPRHHILPTDTLDWFGTLFFFVNGSTVVLLGEGQRRARVRAEANAERAERNQEQLQREAEERNRATRALEEANRRITGIINSITECFFELDRDWRIAALNPPMLAFFGREREEVEGKIYWEVFPEAIGTLFEQCYREALKTQTPQHFEVRTVVVEKWAEVHVYPTDKGLSIYFRDITRRRLEEVERERRTQEIESLNRRLQRAVRETHHRVKNNLQVISALVDLQRFQNELEHQNAVPITELERLSHHVRSLAALHELLTAETATDAEVQDLSLREAMDRLLPLLRRLAGERTIHACITEARLPLKQATAFAVLVNELVSNAVKHGAGDIHLDFSLETGDNGRREEPNFCYRQIGRLDVRDLGPGFPMDFDPRRKANTGMELIDSLGRRDLGGDIRFENVPNGGAQVVVTFPVIPLPVPITKEQVTS